MLARGFSYLCILTVGLGECLGLGVRSNGAEQCTKLEIVRVALVVSGPISKRSHKLQKKLTNKRNGVPTTFGRDENCLARGLWRSSLLRTSVDGRTRSSRDRNASLGREESCHCSRRTWAW